jgi:hypothetical protein
VKTHCAVREGDRGTERARTEPQKQRRCLVEVAAYRWRGRRVPLTGMSPRRSRCRMAWMAAVSSRAPPDRTAACAPPPPPPPPPRRCVRRRQERTLGRRRTGGGMVVERPRRGGPGCKLPVPRPGLTRAPPWLSWPRSARRGPAVHAARHRHGQGSEDTHNSTYGCG